ncbi:MAG: hypothetical protein ACK50J_27885, partial [Planctomyces sp.]
MDSDGDFVIAWESEGEDNSGFAINAQRYNAAGTPQGIEFRVNATTLNDQKAPAVAMDSDGDFIVTWQSYGQDTSGLGIYAQRYSAVGVPRGGEFLVNTTIVGNQEMPSVSLDSDGDFVVTWRNSITVITAQRYNAAGEAQGGEFRVNATTANLKGNPAVSMDSDGDFVVTWESRDQDGSSDGVYAQRFNAAGVAQGNEFRVNTFTTGSQSFPSVAMDADGDLVVAWESSSQDGSFSGVYAQQYQLIAPVQVTSGILSLTGSNLADVMSVERVEPAGSTVYLNAVRNGVNYSIDLAKVTNILMNGSTGDDWLSADASPITPATLNGDGGNDT